MRFHKKLKIEVKITRIAGRILAQRRGCVAAIVTFSHPYRNIFKKLENFTGLGFLLTLLILFPLPVPNSSLKTTTFRINSRSATASQCIDGLAIRRTRNSRDSICLFLILILISRLKYLKNKIYDSTKKEKKILKKD